MASSRARVHLRWRKEHLEIYAIYIHKIDIFMMLIVDEYEERTIRLAIT